MYEIVVRFRQSEEVIETVESLEMALARLQVYIRQRLTVYFRPTVRGALPPIVQPRFGDLKAEQRPRLPLY